MQQEDRVKLELRVKLEARVQQVPEETKEKPAQQASLEDKEQRVQPAQLEAREKPAILERKVKLVKKANQALKAQLDTRDLVEKEHLHLLKIS